MTIPRQPGVSEGAWDRADAVAVKEALMDAQQASTFGRSADVGGPICTVLDGNRSLGCLYVRGGGTMQLQYSRVILVLQEVRYCWAGACRSCRTLPGSRDSRPTGESSCMMACCTAHGV